MAVINIKERIVEKEIDIYPEHFAAILAGTMCFDVVRDQDFREGQIVHIMEFVPADYFEQDDAPRYTGRELKAKIKDVMRRPSAMRDGFVIVFFQKIEK